MLYGKYQFLFRLKNEARLPSFKGSTFRGVFGHALENANCGNCSECFIEIQTVFDRQDQITDLYRKVCGTRPVNEMSDTGITGLNADNFQSYKSRIKEDLQKEFGPYALKELEIASVGTRPNTRYGILMDKAKFEIVY